MSTVETPSIAGKQMLASTIPQTECLSKETIFKFTAITDEILRSICDNNSSDFVGVGQIPDDLRYVGQFYPELRNLKTLQGSESADLEQISAADVNHD